MSSADEVFKIWIVAGARHAGGVESWEHADSGEGLPLPARRERVVPGWIGPRGDGSNTIQVEKEILLRLLEHQSKIVLADFGLEFTTQTVARTPEAAAAAADRLARPVMLKAQVPFGGRGKAGAVKTARNPLEARSAARVLLAMELRGHRVGEVSVEPWIDFGLELYAGVTWDLAARQPLALLSAGGGIEVEKEFAQRGARRHVDPFHGLAAHEGREMAAAIGLTGKILVQVGFVLRGLARAFLELDAVTVEINPLVETADGALVGLDAHVEIDDDAGWRQEGRVAALGKVPVPSGGRAPTPMEEEARRIDAADHRGVAGRVVEFDGDLGLLIGGGGASLTVFDAVLKHGGRPANYSEMGGNPTAEKVAALTRLLIAKPGVLKLAAIMNVVNNTRADIIAEGIVRGIEQAGRDPADAIAVFRVPGSWEPEARRIMAAAGVEAMGREISLDQAARLAVEKVRGDAA